MRGGAQPAHRWRLSWTSDVRGREISVRRKIVNRGGEGR